MSKKTKPVTQEDTLKEILKQLKELVKIQKIRARYETGTNIN